MDDWGATFVRFVLESYNEPYNEYMVHWLPATQDTLYLNDIVELVQYMGTKPGLYALVSLWIHPSQDDMGWPTGATVTAWEKIAEALANQPRVMFGVVNEPKSNYNGAQDADVWEQMNKAVAAIRAVEEANNSPTHIIAVQGTRAWARHLEYYVDHPITAGGGVNIVYETHSYLKAVDFQEVWIKPSETLPVIIGEFGPADIGGGDQMTIEETIMMMDEAEKRDILYAA